MDWGWTSAGQPAPDELREHTHANIEGLEISACTNGELETNGYIVNGKVYIQTYPVKLKAVN